MGTSNKAFVRINDSAPLFKKKSLPWCSRRYDGYILLCCSIPVHMLLRGAVEIILKKTRLFLRDWFYTLLLNILSKPTYISMFYALMTFLQDFVKRGGRSQSVVKERGAGIFPKCAKNIGVLVCMLERDGVRIFACRIQSIIVKFMKKTLQES